MSTMLNPRAHVLTMPKNFIVLRSLQLAIAVILFGFGIFGAVVAPIAGIIVLLVTSICTIIIAGYTIGAQRAKDGKAYNYWAILALEIFLVIFWLISFALLAATVGLIGSLYFSSTSSDYSNYTYTYYTKRSSYSSGFTAAMAILGTAAGLGGLEFAFYIISLVVLSIRIHRHRKAGGHSQPSNTGYAAPEAYDPSAIDQAEKIAVQAQIEAYPVQTQAYPVQTQVYPVQTQAYPMQAQAYPMQAQAYPVESQAYPVQTQASPTQTQALPIQTQASPVQTQAYPVQA